MSTDILARIQAQLHTFSKGQKRIANYILESYDKAAFMTASKLGKTVAVSESTVVRFAVELGFDGYPSMQRSLQEMVRTRLTSVQRIEAANDRFGDQDVVSSVLQSDHPPHRRIARPAGDGRLCGGHFAGQTHLYCWRALVRRAGRLPQLLLPQSF